MNSCENRNAEDCPNLGIADRRMHCGFKIGRTYGDESLEAGLHWGITQDALGAFSPGAFRSTTGGDADDINEAKNLSSAANFQCLLVPTDPEKARTKCPAKFW